MIKYSFGHPHNPRSDDPRFLSEDEACHGAVRHEEESPWDNILAVWEETDDGHATIVCLIFVGEVWRP